MIQGQRLLTPLGSGARDPAQAAGLKIPGTSLDGLDGFVRRVRRVRRVEPVEFFKKKPYPYIIRVNPYPALVTDNNAAQFVLSSGLRLVVKCWPKSWEHP